MIMLCGTSSERLTLDEAIRITDPATCQEALYKYDPEERAAVENEARHIAAQALRAQQTSGWVSVKDRLPKSYVKVLVHCPMTKMATKIEVDYLESRHFSDEWKHGPVTHWQPLPEPPQKGE